MAKPTIRKQLARDFAAGLVESSEIGFQEDHDLYDDEITEAYAEIQRIAKRIERTISK